MLHVACYMLQRATTLFEFGDDNTQTCCFITVRILLSNRLFKYLVIFLWASGFVLNGEASKQQAKSRSILSQVCHDYKS
jgi:hypothetical protein